MIVDSEWSRNPLVFYIVPFIQLVFKENIYCPKPRSVKLKQLSNRLQKK